MSEADSNERIDADILQAKADVLRARGKVALREERTPEEPIVADDFEAAIDIEPLPIEEIPALPIEKVNHTDAAEQAEGEQAVSGPASVPEEQTEPIESGKDISAEPIDVEQDKFDIPSFDLAEEIMAEQRKITATKRKGPGKKGQVENLKPEAESIGHTVERIGPALPEHEQIIEDIVTRDIESLCRGDAPGIQGQKSKDIDKDTEQSTHLQ